MTIACWPLASGAKNTVRKGEIAHIEQFLLFPHCCLPVWRTFCHLYQIWNCCLQNIQVWKSLKFVTDKRLTNWNLYIDKNHDTQICSFSRSRSDCVSFRTLPCLTLCGLFQCYMWVIPSTNCFTQFVVFFQMTKNQPCIRQAVNPLPNNSS